MFLMQALLVFFSAFFIALAVLGLTELFFQYRYKKILKYINDNPKLTLNTHVIHEAQRKFWVWPVKKAFYGTETRYH